MTSINAKVTGDFLFQNECTEATDIYYRINRERKADGFICGRVTMEGSFTGGCSHDCGKGLKASLYGLRYCEFRACQGRERKRKSRSEL